MDVTLERILSLIPKKPDGKFVHGAKREFARSIGYTEGNVVSMWQNGASSSYRDKLFEIASRYNVSVEWLRGETDERQPETQSISAGDQAVLERVHALPPEQRRAFLTLIGLPEETLDELDREARQG